MEGEQSDARLPAEDVLRSAIREYAPVAHNEICRYLSQYVNDPASVRQVIALATEFLLTIPLDGTSFDLPPELAAAVATVTKPFAVHDSVRVSEVIHNAFLIAAELASRRAKAAGVEPRLFLTFVRVLRMLERLVQEFVVRVMKDICAATGKTDRPHEALDPSVGRDAEPFGALSSSDLSIDSFPTRPAWMEDTTPVTPIVLRRNMDVSIPLFWELPQPSATTLNHNETVITVPSENVDDMLPGLLRLFPFSAAAVGMPVLPPQLLHSVDWCRRALLLRDGGLLPDQGDVIMCAEIADVLIASSDQVLVGTVAAQILRPILEMSGYRRQILLETLGAWVRNPDAGVPVIANTLQKHPQTVRYRLRQLRAVLDDVMNDEHKVFCLRNAFMLNLV